MASSSLYLCVDCGGTKTSAVICDGTGRVVGRALGGPSNFSYLGVRAFLDVFKSTVEKALSSATKLPNDVYPTTLDKFSSVWVGVSGVDSPSDSRTLTLALSTVFSIPPGNRLQVTNDAHLLASPLKLNPTLKSAVAVIAGTGSVVVSFSQGSEDGPASIKEMARVGGWGWILGDIGSGFEVGRETIREILWRWDRCTVEGSSAMTAELSPKSLQSRVLSHFGISTVPDIFGVIYAPDPSPTNKVDKEPSLGAGPAALGALIPDPHPTSLLPRERRFSQLTPIVFQAAFEDGDELALTVIKRCAASLANLIASVLTPRSGSVPKNAVDASVSALCLGGSLVGVANYRNLVVEELARLGHIFPIVEFVGGGDVATAGAKGLAAVGA